MRRGTLLYMPPEKLKNPKYVPSSKSEIFSLGVTLYETIFGHQPYVSKKPYDYKEYLRMLQEASPKSVSHLKEHFPNASLAIDKLVRTVMRMIDLSESKRLSAEELEDYVTKYEPFTSLKVEELSLGRETKPKARKKYEEVGRSKIILRGSDPAEGMLAIFSREDSLFEAECFKMCLSVLKEMSAFMQQGVFYAKESKLFQFNRRLGPDFSDLRAADYLEFVVAFLNDSVFQEVSRSLNAFILATDSDSLGDLEFEADLDFVEKELWKIFAEIELAAKKEHLQRFKEENCAAKELSAMLEEIYTETDCVRVNFKEDMLAVLFCKDSLAVVGLAQELSKAAREERGIVKAIKSESYDRVVEIVRKFGEL